MQRIKCENDIHKDSSIAFTMTMENMKDEDDSSYIHFDLHNDNSDTFKVYTNKDISFYMCDKCDYIGKNQSNLKKHHRTHSGEKPYACNICEYTSCDSSNLRKHIKKHSNLKPFPTFTEIISNITAEVKRPKLKIKNIPKNLKCSICEYASSQEIDIKRHMRTHTGEKPYMCNVCDYRSLDKGNLTKHMRRHTGQYPYLCNICEYACRDSSNFKKHIRTHTGEKPFQCNVCNFKSACPANLNSHMKKHTDEERRFFCKMCDYKSMRAMDVKRHIKTHDKKTYSCKRCDFKSEDINILRSHATIHKGRYICPDCGFEAASSNEFNKHIKIHIIPGSTKIKIETISSATTPNIKTECICPMCNLTFSTLIDLQTHLESHAGHYLENFKHFLDV